MVGIEKTQRISRRSVVAEKSSKVSLTLSCLIYYIYICILLRDAMPIDHEASEYLEYKNQTRASQILKTNNKKIHVFQQTASSVVI